MKKLLILCLSLYSAFSFAQTATRTITIAPAPGKSGTPYEVKYVRDWATYPATVTGLNSVTTAIASGNFSLTVVSNGCVIPAGTRPPTVAPTCSGTVTAPAWIAGLRYSKSGTDNLLTIEGAGSIGTIAFHPVVGGGFPTSNPNGVYIAADTPYGPGEQTGQGIYTKEWKLYYSGTTLQLLLSDALSSGTYTATISPANGASRVAIVSPVSSTTAPPVSSTELVTTTYFRDGFGEGTVAQLMQSAPFVPNFADAGSNQYGSLLPGNQTMYIQNSAIKFGIGKALGGAIKWLSIGNGENLVNTNADGYQGVFEGLPAPDGGRSGGWSMYGTPGHGFVDNGMSTSEYFDTGMNWVHGGSAYHDMAKITWYEKRTLPGFGEVMYCRSIPRQWAIRNSDGQTLYHCWWWLSGNAVKYFSILENKRTDTQMIYQGRQQEAPFIFPIAKFWRHKVPVPGGIETITPVPPVEGSPTDGVRWTDTYNAAGHWFAAVNSSDIAVVNIPQFNSRFQGSISQATSGDEFSNATSYNNSAAMMQWADLPGSNVAFSGAFYAGHINDFLNWYPSSGLSYTKFDWHFGDNQTAGWWSENGAAKFINNRYSLNIGFGRPGDNGTPLQGQTVHFASLASPYGYWAASSIPVIYIKGKFPSNITNYVLKFKKPGRDNNPEYTKTFSVNNSGQEQTVAINMAGVSDWNGYISGVRIQMADFLQPTAGTEQFVPTYIGNINPN